MKLTRRALFALLPGGLVWWKSEPKFKTATAINHYYKELDPNQCQCKLDSYICWNCSKKQSLPKTSGNINIMYDYYEVDGRIYPFNVRAW